MVIINVHWTRCDALILSPGGMISFVELSKLSSDDATTLRSLWASEVSHNRERGPQLSTTHPTREGPELQQISQGGRNHRHSGRIDDDDNTFHRLLEHLWTWIVDPILQTLGITDRAS